MTGASSEHDRFLRWASRSSVAVDTELAPSHGVVAFGRLNSVRLVTFGSQQKRDQSAHGALLMHPEALAQNLLQHLAGTTLGQSASENSMHLAPDLV